MKVWIDVLTPKQANLFSVFAAVLREHGHETIVTTRRYREVEQLLKIRNVEAAIIGRHGGGDLAAKLVESTKRTADLTEHVAQKNPDVAISFCSPEAARVAYGLQVPHYAICDSPHAEAVCALSLPLTRRLFTPWIIPKGSWNRYGISSSNIVRYNALDPAVWIRVYAPGPDPRSSLGLNRDEPIIVLRTEEEYASYLLRADIREQNDIRHLVAPLRKLNAQIVVLPRYEKQVEMLTRELADLAVVPSNVIDAVGLLSRASAFVGAGGTMTAEAALMGVPTVSCYRAAPTCVDRYLFKRGLAVRALSPSKIVGNVRRYLASQELADHQKQKAKTALSQMQDPVHVVLSHLALL